MRYDAQELIPASQCMLLKLQHYFDQAILKPVYLSATLLDPQIETSLLTPLVLGIMKKTKEEILATFQDLAEVFLINKEYQSNMDTSKARNSPKKTI